MIQKFLEKFGLKWFKTKNNAGIFTAYSWLLIIFLASLGTTGLIWGLRELKLLQKWELDIYDFMLRSRNREPADSRILLVSITEDDLSEKKWNLSTQTINTLLAKLESYQPRIIGVNIYLPNQENFSKNLPVKDYIFASCLLSNVGRSEIPPPNISIENVGFNDLIIDSEVGNVVRRALLFSSLTNTDKKCQTQFSLGAKLALSYLEKQGIQYKFNQHKQLEINNIVFPRLDANAGNYQNTDFQGYQILLNYRHPQNLVPIVTLSQVMNDEVNPNLIKDKLVMIGTTAYSSDNIDSGYYTPYSASENQPLRMPRLFIQAQITSQILSTVLDGRSLISYWPDHIELLWILIWSFIGAILAWQWRHILLLLLMLSFMIMSLIAITVVLFLQSLWIPIISPIMALLISSFLVNIYGNSRTENKILNKEYLTKDITIKVEEQAEAIAQLNSLFNQTTLLQSENNDPTIVPQIPILKTGGLLLGGRYEISQTLGSGGFGRTYLAIDHHLPNSKICVVKQLMPARRDAKFLEIARRLFHTEAEILAALGNHPQIPELLAYFEDDHEFYLVQEYIEGHTLNTELISPQNEDFVIKMIQEVLEILVFVHHHQVIHRDIKPTNIIRCRENNKLVLIDFGAVKCIQPMILPGMEAPTIAIGTKGYTPPEQFAGHPRLCSDIYALGMMAIQAITGISPQELQIDPQTGNYLWRSHVTVNDQLADILDRMVCYHFGDRYQSALIVLEDLKTLMISK